MTSNPKEKSKELIEEFRPFIDVWDYTNDAATPEDEVLKECAKCALIGVNQILKLSGLPQFQIIFWRQVKEELENYINCVEIPASYVCPYCDCSLSEQESWLEYCIRCGY